MPEAQPASRTQVKSRSGCQRCKQRKIKCDETIPSCNQCTRKGFECPGYNRPVKWSSKYQISEDVNEQKQKANTSQRDVPGFADGVKKMQAALALSSPGEEQSTGAAISKHRSVFKTSVDQRSPSERGIKSDRTSVSPSSLFSSPTGSTELPLRSSPVPYYPEKRPYHHERQSYQQDRQTDSEFPSRAQTQWPVVKVAGVPRYIEDRSTSISRHYFTSFCLINCCFDSPKNSFRATVSELMLTSPLIYHSMLALSAAMMGQHRHDMMTASLEHKIEAIRCMKSELMMIKNENSSTDVVSSRVGPEVLISCILLGLTDAWHNRGAPPMNHLHGARVLFKNWISDIQKSTKASLALACASPARSFLVGIISYWESSSCTGITQPPEVVDYLFPFCDQDQIEHIYPNPWTGIATPIFIYWAKTGNLARHKSILRRVFRDVAAGNRDRLQANLVEQAWKVEQAVLRYEIPGNDKVEDTEDELTPVSHLQSVAQALKLATLLQLYLDFPELLQERISTAADWSDTTPSPPGYEVGDLPSSIEVGAKVLALTMRILTIASSIPQSSGAHTLLLLPLIVAGTTLQPGKISSVMHSPETSKYVLSPEIISLATTSHEGGAGYLQWRGFIKEQFNDMCRRLGLKTVIGAVSVVDEVWRRADVAALNEDIVANNSDTFVHWIDLTTEGEVGSVYS